MKAVRTNMSKNEVATKAESNLALPAHLQRARTASIGNIDQSDLIIPRVKLLQAISPEVTDYEKAKAGEFWHNGADMSLGKMVRVVPIKVTKSLVLWAPRGDDRGILARSDDGIHWDKPNEKFEVKPKGSPKKIVWDTGDDVKSSRLAEFGSSIPEDRDSQPAAALTYNWLFYFIDFPELSHAVVLNTRSSVKPAKQLISKLEMGAVEPFFRIYEMSVVEAKGAEGPYNNYQYTSSGYVEDEGIAKITEGLYEHFKDKTYRANDEADETDSNMAGGGGEPDTEDKAKMRKKFS
jgi:hypothetical protein